LKKDEFNKLEMLEQLKYINKELLFPKSLRIISSELNMSKTTIRDRFFKIGYIYNADTKQYIKNNSIKVQLVKGVVNEPQRAIKHDTIDVIQKDTNSISDDVIPKDNNCISEVTITTQENNLLKMQEFTDLKTTLEEVKELLEMKDQLKEVIQQYNKSKSIIEIPEQQPLRIDRNKLNGELKGRLVKVYSNINDNWISFCKDNNAYKMQDLYSLALMEFMDRYSKK